MCGEPGKIDEGHACCLGGERGQPADRSVGVGSDRPPIRPVLADGLYAVLLLCGSWVGRPFHPDESTLQFWAHVAGSMMNTRISLTPKVDRFERLSGE